MPSADPTTIAVSRRDDALVFDGVLTRPVVASAWRQAVPLVSNARKLDLNSVSRIDSAGLAMLSTLVQQAGITDIQGTPTGYAELRAAYRLDDSLTCATS